jgi:hypothetical protein
MSLLGYATVHGTAATLRAISRASYSPTTGLTTDTPTNTSVSGVLVEYEAHELNDQIQAGDRRFLLPATQVSTAPVPDDHLIVGSQTFRIVRVTPLQAPTLNRIYDLQLRGGP